MTGRGREHYEHYEPGEHHEQLSSAATGDAAGYISLARVNGHPARRVTLPGFGCGRGDEPDTNRYSGTT